jgi:uncharacterized protein (DUF1684 family)
MPTKFKGFAVDLPANGYVQMDEVNGTCDVTITNQTNASIFVVTNAGNATEAAAEETAGRYLIVPANSAYVHTFSCNPSRTYVEWQGTTVGSNRHSFVISW